MLKIQLISEVFSYSTDANFVLVNNEVNTPEV